MAARRCPASAPSQAAPHPHRSAPVVVAEGVEAVKDERCVVEVGTHPGPFWKDRNSGMVVCTRHRAQYEERAAEFGPFDWQEA